MLLRVVLMNVDMVKGGLLQTEDVDHSPMKDVIGLCKELVKAPALLLICLQDVGKNWCQEALKAPETAKCRSMSHNALLPEEDTNIFRGFILLGQAAGNRHLVAPLDLPIFTLLVSRDGSWRFLCDDLIPGQMVT